MHSGPTSLKGHISPAPYCPYNKQPLYVPLYVPLYEGPFFSIIIEKDSLGSEVISSQLAVINAQEEFVVLHTGTDQLGKEKVMRIQWGAQPRVYFLLYAKSYHFSNFPNETINIGSLLPA